MVSLLLWAKDIIISFTYELFQWLSERDQYLSLAEKDICHINPIEHHLGQFGSRQARHGGQNIQGTGQFMGDTYRKAAMKKRVVAHMFKLEYKKKKGGTETKINNTLTVPEAF